MIELHFDPPGFSDLADRLHSGTERGALIAGIGLACYLLDEQDAPHSVKRTIEALWYAAAERYSKGYTGHTENSMASRALEILDADPEPREAAEALTPQPEQSPDPTHPQFAHGLLSGIATAKLAAEQHLSALFKDLAAIASRDAAESELAAPTAD